MGIYYLLALFIINQCVIRVMQRYIMQTNVSPSLEPFQTWFSSDIILLRPDQNSPNLPLYSTFVQHQDFGGERITDIFSQFQTNTKPLLKLRNQETKYVTSTRPPTLPFLFVNSVLNISDYLHFFPWISTKTGAKKASRFDY